MRRSVRGRALLHRLQRRAVARLALAASARPPWRRRHDISAAMTSACRDNPSTHGSTSSLMARPAARAECGSPPPAGNAGSPRPRVASVREASRGRGAAGRSPRRRAPPIATRLHDYAERHLGVVRGDDRPRRPACRPTSSRATAAAASRPRPPTSAPTCGARSPRGGCGIISRRELVARLSRTLATLERMERYEDTGQFYNWYDHRTGAKLTAWPPRPQDEFHPILSSVDNGWLAVGLKIVARSVPGARAARPGALRGDGLRLLLRARGEPGAVPLPPRRPRRVAVLLRHARQREPHRRLHRHRPRAAAADRTYYGRWRTFPDTCEYSFQETKPVGEWRRYLGVDVFEGAYRYSGIQLVPSWGGSMFEALMPALFVPEEDWAPRSWGAEPSADRAGADLPRDERGRLRLLGLLAGEQARGRLRRLGRGRRRHGPERHALERGRHAGGPRLPGLPRPPGEARPAAVGLHQRRRHAARGLPRAALRAARDARPTCAGWRATSPACTGSGASATA